ncbi:hypothetical protein [Undibacterium sp. Ren11W]|uniref:hypothetical protein n=1 Tax=Undibacterium sp. Ren11W TaxID=3413045 RepID=UPI003BF10F51
MSAVTTCMEHDRFGDREAPAAAYSGVHTLGALEHFDITAAAHLSGRGVAEIVLKRTLMSPEPLAEVLRPEVLTRPQMLLARVA